MAYENEIQLSLWMRAKVQTLGRDPRREAWGQVSGLCMAYNVDFSLFHLSFVEHLKPKKGGFGGR